MQLCVLLCSLLAVSEQQHANLTACSVTDRLLLSTDIYDYHYVSNGKTTVDSIDDHEEMKMTDVSVSDCS